MIAPSPSRTRWWWLTSMATASGYRDWQASPTRPAGDPDADGTPRSTSSSSSAVRPCSELGAAPSTPKSVSAVIHNRRSERRFAGRHRSRKQSTAYFSCSSNCTCRPRSRRRSLNLHGTPAWISLNVSCHEGRRLWSWRACCRS
jgi:hypothetical protein